MSQPGEEQEEVKEIVAREDTGAAPGAADGPVDEPENDAARGSWGWILLVGIVVAIVAYVVYLALS